MSGWAPASKVSRVRAGATTEKRGSRGKMTIEELIAYVETDPIADANPEAHEAVIAALYLAREAAGVSRRRPIGHLDEQVVKMNQALAKAKWK